MKIDSGRENNRNSLQRGTERGASSEDSVNIELKLSHRPDLLYNKGICEGK